MYVLVFLIVVTIFGIGAYLYIFYKMEAKFSQLDLFLDPTKKKAIKRDMTQSHKELCNHKLQMSLDNYKPQTTPFHIFISYRRADGREHARCISLALKLYGYKKIILDTDSIKYGEFPKRIVDSIYSCEYFILILSPKSLNRCVMESDSVAKEIRIARYYHKTIIPIIIDGRLPKLPWKLLPKDLRFIQKIQYHDHKTDSYFEYSIEKLCDRLTLEI